MTNTTDTQGAEAPAEDAVNGPTEHGSSHTTAGTDAQPEGAPSTDDVMSAASTRIKELEDQLAAEHDKWMRSEAEMQNLRARAKRDVDDARQYAVQKFARDVVEAAENLKRALANFPPRAEGEDKLITTMREGIEGTERSFLSILERHGVVSEDPSGKPFDANQHQAMAEQPSAEHAHGTVMQAWTPTWTLHGRLLKPAMVVVAKNEGGAS
ncbi:heat shock protein GrpE [Acetobacter estunensis NRIC 0472]|uniref:Protein GrpE n=1 Tax=Acetobacter estunensis TaxID=104097 RepID=A0A967B8P2_9PROT|nr:nucleotide exchange factor GrpE [Acetobacter estunensis]NHO54206.1 nucleotide exchange factor GrpE [Acetobacter estunensis]GBQ24370.1 heat shock protein GrpE [Acetobacter estunensis NRIC 0472]